MTKHIVFLMLAVVFCQTVFGEGFLTAQKFPTTFNDLSFVERVEVLREGYMPYRVEYDENGVCISGCAYKGITIKEDMSAVDAANEEIAKLINQSKSDMQMYGENQWQTANQDWCRNGLSPKLPLRYPVDMSNFRYSISSDFGFRISSPNGSGFHPALDISCPKGTPVYATADGVITSVGYEQKTGGAGRYISILHENGLITQYLHLEKILVNKGDKVNACQQIALSGASGVSVSGGEYSPHLDYRIRFNSDTNKYVDILCPCKNADRTNYQSSSTDLSCEHSLFNAKYKFEPYDSSTDDIKRSNWRVKYGHCMRQNIDLLPDEVK